MRILKNGPIKTNKISNIYPCSITDVYLLTTLYVLEVTREDTKEVKELIEILTEYVCNAEKINAQRFRQMKEHLTQLIESKLANPKVPVHGELYSFCFCFS